MVEKEGLYLIWVHTLDTWSTVRYTGGTFRKCCFSFAVFLLVMASPLSVRHTSCGSVGVSSFPQSQGCMGVNQPEQPGHHICQVAMTGAGTGSWLNLRAESSLRVFFQNYWKRQFLFTEVARNCGHEVHLVYYVVSSSRREKQREFWRHHLRPWVQLWLQTNKYFLRKNGKSRNAYQSWGSVVLWYCGRKKLNTRIFRDI